MSKCAKCGSEVLQEDLYEDRGKMICEDCKLEGTVSPSKPCGGEN